MEVWQEVENVLQQVEDGVVHGQFASHHLLEVVANVLEVLLQALQGEKLAADALAERAHRLVLNVSGGCVERGRGRERGSGREVS